MISVGGEEENNVVVVVVDPRWSDAKLAHTEAPGGCAPFSRRCRVQAIDNQISKNTGSSTPAFSTRHDCTNSVYRYAVI